MLFINLIPIRKMPYHLLDKGIPEQYQPKCSLCMENPFSISPHFFFQVNSIQTEVLYGKALEYLDLKGGETVFDLYCGIGTISLFLSQKAKKEVKNARF